jgi:phytoene dehydrogenase-like protein
MAGSGRVVIIGAGHNGLVAAFYLAKAGFTPLVLEGREVVGGIAAIEEIHPGFRCPAILYRTRPFTIALHPDGNTLRLTDQTSTHEAERYLKFRASLKRLAAALQPLLSNTPPDIDRLKMEDYVNVGKFGLKFRALDRKDAYRLLRWIPMPVADLVAEWFENELLRATIAARGIFGCFAGPSSGGTGATLLLQMAVQPDSLIRAESVDLAQALADGASQAGAEIRTHARVSQIRVKSGEVSSVVLENGEEIAAKAVISSADPRQTFLQLLDVGNLDPGFLMKVRSYRATGIVGKVNLALSGLPSFPSINDGNDLSGHIHIGPDLQYLERAFDAAKYGEFSARPYMDITIPSIENPSLAPSNRHVMSIHVQYAPYHLKQGEWNTRRDEFADAVVKTVSEYAPKLRDLIVHRQVITPLDMEKIYGLSGGHIFHGEHALDQLFAFRPFLGWARYRTPIQGLYLCGSGTHPGGGITGVPGANASRQIVKDLKSRN